MAIQASSLTVNAQEIGKIIDLPALQLMMDDLYDVTKIGFSLIDLEGNLLVGTGWQDICTNFHRKNPQTHKNCLESDLNLTHGVKEGEYRIYECKNGLIDIVTPLFIGGIHIANIFSGQFLFTEDGEDLDRFVAQAEKHGFDKEAYTCAYKNVPRWERGKVECLMEFYTKLTDVLSKKGLANLKLSNLLDEETRIKQELKSSQEDLNRAQSVAKIGSWRVHVQGELFWSDETYHIFRVPKGTPMTYEAFLKFVHPDDCKHVDEQWQATLKGKPYDIEHRIIVNGKTLWVREKAELEFDSNGKLRGGFGTVQDITERKEAEEALKESEEKFRIVAEAAKVLVYEVNLTANTITIFRGEDVLGYNVNEIPRSLGWWFNQLHPDDRAKAQQEARLAIKTGVDTLIEYRIRRKQGDYITVHDTTKTITDESRKVNRIIGGLRDVTERKQNEEALMYSKQLLEKKAAEVEAYASNMESLASERLQQLKNAERLAAIGATAGMVGHDIRNPLQAMMSDVYLLKDELSSMPNCTKKEGVTESLEGIEKNIIYINKIVADLQDFARPLNPRAEDTNLKHIIDELLRHTFLQDNIEVNAKVESDVSVVRADSIFLNRIMFNLLNNAVQAMPKGGKLSIHAYKDKQKNDVIITVEDTGVGIPEHARAKLFTPMFTTKSKGQGFGLAVVKRMTEALGGTVTFESQEDKGTKFKIELPQN